MHGGTAKVGGNRATYVFLAPINNLVLTDSVNFEFKVINVTFIDGNKLYRIRKRIGIPHRISTLKKNPMFNNFLKVSKVYATTRLTGTLSTLKPQFFNIARDELALLNLSLLGYSRRRERDFLYISEDCPSCLFLNSTNARFEFLNNPSPLSLDGTWVNCGKRSFYLDLLKILRNETRIRIAASWVDDLKRASILAGQSQCSYDIPQAFLFNMIALELLITQRGDKVKDALPARAESFLGWIGFWEIDDYPEKIKDIYEKRCSLVHQGSRNEISLDDLIFTDNLLLNLLNNIVRHISLFRTKQDIIDFSKKVEAEHILGIRQRVRPKTMTFVRP